MTEIDPERRFTRATKEGPIPEARPDLGACLIYTGADNGNGYGQFRYNGRSGYAHRYAWERVNGPIPEGLTVDHLCYVRRCVRLEHLELVEGVENYRRAVARRTHCPNGHEYTPENTGSRRGGRVCLTCRRVAWQKSARPSLKSRGIAVKHAKISRDARAAMVAELMSGDITLRQASTIYGLSAEQVRRSAWREVRRQLASRDGGRCCRCGNQAEEVHHRLPRRRGSTNRGDILFGLANLVSLCRECHRWTEDHPADAYATGWLVHANYDPADVEAVPL